MIEEVFSKGNIVHLGAAFYLAGFLFRDQIMLRGLIIVGDLIYLLYFLLAPEVPLWGGIFWSSVFIAVNLFMIAHIVADRMHFRMGEEETRLFRALYYLSPGEFRRLVRAGVWRTADTVVVLTVENKRLDRLHFVLDGAITIEKAGYCRNIGSCTFIGEVAFLLSRPASATVTVEKGARYIEWEANTLNRLLLRAPSLRIALSSALNRDMAAKVAKA
jgi:hypothetical protein